ncbi:UNVERIFIED_CONTAM: hypothetical protein K2H54_036051 [Gekko kuhli]
MSSLKYAFAASFLEQLHKHQGAVLHPDYKTSFRSFEDAAQRLLPYHVYQGTLPSPHDYRKAELAHLLGELDIHLQWPGSEGAKGHPPPLQKPPRPCQALSLAACRMSATTPEALAWWRRRGQAQPAKTEVWLPAEWPPPPPPPQKHSLDEEFEMVSAQLLKRTQAMLNKYRLLLLEESRRVSPSAEMVMIDRMFIQEEKTTLALDKQLAKEKPDEEKPCSPLEGRSPNLGTCTQHGVRIETDFIDTDGRSGTDTPIRLGIEHGPDEYVSSSSRSQSFASSLAQGCVPSSVASASENLKAPPVQMATPINPTKLVIKHSGGSPSVTWAKASPSLDGDDDALPSRSKPPIKTYEARSRIGLKLKIKQEAGLSKVVHNTALDPVHQTPPPVCTTYRENVDAFVADKAPDTCAKGSAPKADTVPSTLIIKQDGGSRSVITSHKTHESPSGAAAEKGRPEENAKHTFFNRSDARSLVMQESPAPPKSDDPTSGLMKELAEVEDEFYHRMIKTEPPDHGSASDLTWEVPLPPAKRRKSESFDVDNASFSSDSPQDDSLNEHLQSAIDSILNLQQPQAGGQNIRTPSSSYNSSSPPFSSPAHRTDTYLAPNHNGGLGARTLNR